MLVMILSRFCYQENRIKYNCTSGWSLNFGSVGNFVKSVFTHTYLSLNAIISFVVTLLRLNFALSLLRDL